MKRAIPLHFSEQLYNLLPEEDGKFTTLRELFELAPNKLISIDIKGDSDELKHKVNDLIKEFKREHLTIWGSMKPKHHNRIKEINPMIPQFFSATQCIWVYFLYYTGLLFLCPLPADVFMVPLFTKSKLHMMGKMLKHRSCLLRVIVVILRIMTMNSKYLYRHLRKRGVLVVVWVLNEDEEFEEALSFGDDIDGMMTDCPSKLRNFIKARNEKTHY